MNIAAAYPDERILSYVREAALEKGKQITIHDRYEGCLPSPVLSLMFYEEPVISGNTVTVGDLGSFAVSGASNIKKEIIPITDERLKIAWKHDIYRLLVSMGGQELTLTIR